MSSTAARMTSAMLRARKTTRPIASPTRRSTPGARNFSGASRKEMASTIPIHTKTAAVAVAVTVHARC